MWWAPFCVYPLLCPDYDHYLCGTVHWTDAYWVENSLVIAFLIAVFDILPVLGTGGIMIPWTVITALTGSHGLALGLLVVVSGHNGCAQYHRA